VSGWCGSATRRAVPRHVSKTTMANSLVVHGAIFAVGALVGGGIATAIARKNETTSSRGIMRPQQPVAPILQVGTTGSAVITSDVGVISPPLKYGNPGAWSPSPCEGYFIMSLFRSNYRPTRPQSLCGWLRSPIEAPRLGASCSPNPHELF